MFFLSTKFTFLKDMKEKIKTASIIFAVIISVITLAKEIYGCTYHSVEKDVTLTQIEAKMRSNEKEILSIKTDLKDLSERIVKQESNIALIKNDLDLVKRILIASKNLGLLNNLDGELSAAIENFDQQNELNFKAKLNTNK